MKTLFLSFFLLIFSVFYLFAQDVLQVKEYKLSNGLKVYLNVDHTQPLVFGAIAVNGGAKRDPGEATGIAHYLEHMMFKGTDKMGTINYQVEKIYLDSITLKYDELAKTKGETERQAIQLQINKLAQKASEFAIPNEFDKIMADIGGSFVNAFTSEDVIAYFNMFPSNQMEKWMEIYSHRFENPVFRLFQSELETVYEEKNMSMDNFGNVLIETYLSSFFKKHPYGQQTVLGKTEHLKNPSLTKMYEYFRTYYVPNNMALMLAGDFNPEEVMPMIEEKFGKWEAGVLPSMPIYSEEAFKGREFIKVKMSPIPLGVIGYRTVPKGNDDEIKINVLINILTNSSSTGLLDKVYHDNKIMFNTVMPYNLVDEGGLFILFAPKLLKQSLKGAESIVMAEIEKLKSGDFDESLLEGVKTSMKKDFQSNLENMQWRPFQVLDCFLTGQTWENKLEFPQMVDQITKNDIIAIANKYLNDNRLVMFSKMGFPKKEKLEKPAFEPVIPQNAEAKSEFYNELDRIETKPSEPNFIEFGKDVLNEDLSDKVHFYYATNPVNDIFSLTFKYGAGTYIYPRLDYAAQYMGLLGTGNKTFETFSRDLQKLGSSLSIYSSGNYLTISLDGFESNLDQTLQLLNELLTKPAADPKQLEKFAREAKSNLQQELKDPATVGSALAEYALYKDKSSFINRLSIKEVSALNSDSLLNDFKNAMKYELSIHYCGKKSMQEVENLIISFIKLPENPKPSNSPIIRPRQVYSENTIYLIDDPKAIQSQINIYREGKMVDNIDKARAKAFNEYFGNGMSAIVFQEIREFRSLAYTAYATYNLPFYQTGNGYINGFLSTQSDKTVEAIKAMTELMDELPRKPERMDLIKKTLLQSVNSERPTFRNLSSTVETWQKQGYPDDPRREFYDQYQLIYFDDIIAFWTENVDINPFVITIAGDKSRMDLTKLAQYGKIIEVDKKSVFKE